MIHLFIKNRRCAFLVFLAGNFFCTGLKGAEALDDLTVRAELSQRKLDKNPGDEKAWAELVRSRLLNDDFEYAAKALEGWRSAIPHPEPTIDELAAELALAREDNAGAVSAWKRYLESNPKDAKAWNQLADAYSYQGDWGDAVDAMGNVLQIKPDAAGFAKRADFWIRLHEWASAENDVKQGSRLDATNHGIQKLLPIFEREAEWLPVVQKLDAVIAKDPGNVGLLMDRAEWMMGLHFRGAGEDDVEAAFKLAPGSLRARVWHGVLAKNGKRGGAIQLVDVSTEFEVELKKLEASDDFEARSWFLLKYHAPLLALDEVQKLDGSAAKAIALLDLNRLPEAGIAGRRAVETHPRDSQAWFALGRLEFENGNLGEALDALKHSIQLKKTEEAVALQKTIQQRRDPK